MDRDPYCKFSSGGSGGSSGSSYSLSPEILNPKLTLRLTQEMEACRQVPVAIPGAGSGLVIALAIDAVIEFFAAKPFTICPIRKSSPATLTLKSQPHDPESRNSFPESCRSK